ncbi:uncharacterized protein BT62DRAFT_982655 [Guyanagaster necrorhizus]|uniref:DUF3533 domain-containing protein n=1 Tax=Guyanagaster necrorhizus TaxID=856835 RepID=A0A9P7VIN5_9AGAR|nr:uncharacterized protein BT62DRAFT_982655 [Guyanagaster necrorhizus MCA 3950]KAG7441781.1 hypothetical protein BT62DRAFT_982655 [Guyanagaster necrorhizus MCA 3950]
MYFKILFGGCFAMVIVMFSVFSIYWGALWKIPDHNLRGWVVDFDGSAVGTAVVQGLTASSSSSKVTFTQVSASEFPGGWEEVANRVVEQKAWVAVVVQSNATGALNAAVSSVNSSYDGTEAITFYGVEARNENAYRSLIRPSVQALLIAICQEYAQQFVSQIASSSSLSSIASSAPQILTEPISYTTDNLVPFDIPVASAITFVGLIYLLILSFFIVMIGASAREISGLERKLTTVSLIRVRLISVFIAYFMISLFYSLLSRAFQVNFSRKFGDAGFVIFWMVNFVGMLSVGLALEAMITLLTVRFVPFFMILWIISNVSVSFMPLDVLPNIYRYGYAMPFYNVSGAVRTILFGTKNELGLHFGVLIAWTVVSLITLPTFQWFMRRKNVPETTGLIEEGEKGAGH